VIEPHGDENRRSDRVIGCWNTVIEPAGRRTKENWIRTLNEESDPKSMIQRAVNQQKKEHRTSEKDPRAKIQRALNRQKMNC